MRSFLALGVAVLVTGCSPVLRFTRPTGPEASLGTVRTLSVAVATDMGRSVESSVVNGLFRGEVPIPVPVHAVVRERLIARLEQLGYVVCPQAPCGDGAMTVTLTESAVNTEFTQSGPRAHVRVTAVVKVTQNDGQTPFDYTFWNKKNGRAENAGQLVAAAADGIAGSFAATLLPGSERTELPLEDGGDLSMGVNMLYSSNWDGAVQYFSELTRSQPDLDGAWYDLGVAWEAKGEWTAALNAYEQAAARARKRHYLDAVSHARRMVPAR